MENSRENGQLRSVEALLAERGLNVSGGHLRGRIWASSGTGAVSGSLVNKRM